MSEDERGPYADRMIKPYDEKYGTWFEDYHSAQHFGLYPRSKPVILTPETQTNYVEVPGMDGNLDMTEALDGLTHYRNREGTFEFTCIGRENWDAAYHLLKTRLHGKYCPSIVLDEDPTCMYRGRLFVEEPEYNKETGEAFFTVRGDIEPFRRETTLSPSLSTLEEWKWDYFSFVTGIVRDYHHIEIKEHSIEIKRQSTPPAIYESINTITIPEKDGKRILTIHGSGMTVVPNIIVSSANNLSVTYINNKIEAKTVDLTVGDNEDKMLDFVLSDDSPVELEFTGTGVISIYMETGLI